MVLVTVIVTIYLAYTGYSYYSLPREEQFYHDHHLWFKPSGVLGHGLGIAGTLLIMIGVFLYIARKRYGFMERLIRLKYLLEFHIFLCVLGPIMILFHTAFKFGGLISVAFWSMVAVVASGVIGRFIYIQIPRTIEGRELSLQEVKAMRADLSSKYTEGTTVDTKEADDIVSKLRDDLESNQNLSFFKKYFKDRQLISTVRRKIKYKDWSREDKRSILKTIQQEIKLSNRIQRLHQMQQLFKYWHVAHLPFALIMLIIVIIHVAITLVFGYKWIF
jgi:hypothetical protein